MKGFLGCFIVYVMFFLTACPAPVAVQTALRKQAEEIEIVKNSYQKNIMNLLDTIENLQIELLNKIEIETKSKKYFEKEIGKPVTSSTNPNLLIISVQVEKTLNTYFNQKRQEVRNKIAVAKSEYLKLTISIDNIDKINKATIEYIDSLVRLRQQTSAMATAISSKVSTLVSGGVLDIAKLDLVKIPDLLVTPSQ